MVRWPGKLGGRHKLVGWLNAFLDASRAHQVKQIIGGRLIENSDGKILVVGEGGPVEELEYPFKIVQSADWLTYQVRPGWVITTGAPITPTMLDTDLTLTSGVAKFYFVLRILSPTTAAISTSSTEPVWGIDKIPIGWVDTASHATDSPPSAEITQFLHDNVFSPCVTSGST